MATEKTSSSILRSVKTQLKRGARLARSAVVHTAASVSDAVSSLSPSRSSASANMPHRRFLSDNPMLYKSAIEAAESYVSKLDDGDVGWLHSKPFDPTPGNPQYFRLMFDLMNILQTMQLPIQGRILEIGSGPGWVTEILLMLGYSVDALEPSADLINIAQERCAGLNLHYRHAIPPKVRFHQTTLEEVEFKDESFDAILYFDVLHHVVNEDIAMEKSFRFLRSGGSLGVVEGAWRHDDKELEATLLEEMRRFGTLENPFSAQYLDHLLAKSGFVCIKRYVGVNGFFSKKQLGKPLKRFAACPLAGSNNVTARKPGNESNLYPACIDFKFSTHAKYTLIDGGIDAASRTASLLIEFKNTGETLLDSCPSRTGHITLALRQGAPGSKVFLECLERHALSETLIPGEAVQMKMVFTLPPEVSLDNWELDAVAEDVFWLSSRDSQSCPVPVV